MLTNPDGLNDLTGAIIDAAITVHRETGPGLLEAVYLECLTYELLDRNFDVETNQRVPLVYRGHTRMNHYFLDLRVNGKVIIELKSVSALAPIHTAQLLTYLRLTGCPVGQILNFTSDHQTGFNRVIRPGLDKGAGLAGYPRRKSEPRRLRSPRAPDPSVLKRTTRTPVCPTPSVRYLRYLDGQTEEIRLAVRR